MLKKPVRQSSINANGGSYIQRVVEVNEKLNETINSVNVVTLSIDKIKNPAFHDRTKPLLNSIKELSLNIQKSGKLINPITVRRLEDGNYERISGYRRLEAVKLLFWTEIDAIVMENISDDIAALIMISENINREDLNVYDETLAVLQYISISLGITIDETKKNLYKLRNNSLGNTKSIDEAIEEFRSCADEIVKKTGKYELSTFMNRLDVLKMHPMILDAMHCDKISYTYAKELKKIKDIDLLKKIIDDPMPLNELKEFLHKKNEQKNNIYEIKNRFKKMNFSIYNKLDSKKKKRVDTLMKELEELLF